MPMFRQKRQWNAGKSSTDSGVIVEDISKELIPIFGSCRYAVVLHNILTPDECTAMMRRAEDEGFDDALVQGPGGRQILRQDIRSCGRCMFDDAGLADTMYSRILNALHGTALGEKLVRAPWISSDIRAVGLNERMRFLKYGPGQFFAPHQDLRFIRGPDAGDRAGETSHITVQLYLNEKFKGGATRFLCGKRHYDVRPRTGSVLIFDHDILHEGQKVSVGIKYSVRTDIMFTPIGGDSEDESVSEGSESDYALERMLSGKSK